MADNSAEGTKDSLKTPSPRPFWPPLIFAQNARPLRPFPMLFAPAFLFTSYASLQGFKTDTAGISATLSGLYFLLASRRRQPLGQKFGPRGIVRGVTMGFCLINMVSGGLAYTLGRREEEENKK
ncbi:hypothetical protein N7492_005046 [Penicillium capsulatum]|uniref:Uncharacterized protein n=1 Tax=Penicillium capsulatum TaxID=69766 RepID=A0A9W9IB47_9EURO|nr:hypothetical protein N7492_005046 [Penicillium capsulatum]